VSHRPYVEYRLINGAWQEVPLPDERIGAKVNLLQRSDAVKGKDVSLEEKQKVDGYVRVPIWLKVIRETAS